MPTYVYACQACGAQFEQFQRFSDEPLTICPRCQGTIKRVFQPVGVVFKGSGWYINDSRSGNNSSTSKASTPAAPSSDASPAAPAAATSESKPEAPKAETSKSEPSAAA
ncbi:FmdB family zinc ribbon protein [Herpetosiphon geysericola]|uniref:FmdB family transcriptional regulator n=1 Tax=Herpetosiphon geysericola TaxID=70996 RepID=A0A0P6YBF8_9CHLR|nr:FmdB family zinc ribbon protein [Herpetosiphon geysericola]KPL90600.1 FmdB family transcriptional regulator [Herpetosiphon geysericola]